MAADGTISFTVTPTGSVNDLEPPTSYLTLNLSYPVSGSGGTDTDSATLTINNVAPTVTAATDQTANEGASTDFDLGSFTDPGDDDPWVATINWGDSSSNTFSVTSPGSLGSLSHTYANEGLYTVSISVAEDGGAGASHSDTFSVDVAPSSVTANAGGPYVINEGQPVTLNASGSAAGGSASYRWDIDGDGDFDENVTGVNPTLSWSQLAGLGIDDGPHDRTVTVEVSDGSGGGGGPTVVFDDDFDPSIEPEMWPSISNGVASNVSGTVSTNVLYFTGSGSRDEATRDLDV